MIRSLFKHEFMLMLKSKKNNIFIGFLFILLLAFCFIIQPNQETVSSFNPNLTEQELELMAAQQEARMARGSTGFGHFTGNSVYATTAYNYRLHNKMKHAYEDEDFTRFLHLLTYTHESGYSSFIDDVAAEFALSPSPVKDQMHLFHQTLFDYETHLAQGERITYPMIEQKTAVQTMQNALLSPVTYLLLFAVIYFSSDIVTHNRSYKTLLQGLPMPWYRQLNIKSFTSFTYTLAVLFILMLTGMGILTAINGFGFFNISVPVVTINGNLMGEDYAFIAYSEFLLKTFSVFVVIVYLLNRLCTVLSLLFKNQWIVLFIATIVLFSEQFYYSRSTRYLFGMDVSNFPQTYFEFGNVVTGEKIFLLNIDTVTYAKGITVLVITIVLIEITLFLVSKLINKRRFYA
ncbi:hypothetical protein [Oceanobacillus picturae]|uniref:hypothetical protein n=1 Tax=Oceanobacillus picturae TaxID=171693 RepID=UPI000E69135D|nr:hypothetical protein [Oceanobacillus picturae]RIU91157.1 hypothetical protein D1864_12115 [Oceanobacillus picturae]